MTNLKTKNTITWCPGCPNFMILESAKKALSKFNQEELAIVTGIGCHAKIFDYLNVSGIYGLHGRVIPTALGITLGNPKLKVIGFAGDGDTYAEGMAHFIHTGRYNANMTLIVHDNQSFSLTTGQPTPTSQQGYSSKAKPQGEESKPLNPIKLSIASGATFIARTNARDINHTAEIIEKAVKHPGFAFIEIIQDCLIFNKELNNKDKLMYKIKDNSNFEKAYSLAKEWDYNKKKGKIPLGVLYQIQEPTLKEKLAQLRKN
tara:strand:- start:1792 stop:2571 length:780 start_codon:yes stop_codon:yes gene_type:complete